MSSPENVDPSQLKGRSMESPEEELAPKKSRYGRVIVKKGFLPGEDQLPKDRRKKGKREEPLKAKRKYTKRNECIDEATEKNDTAVSVVKKTKEARKEKEKGKKDVEVKTEEPDEFYVEKESDGEDYDGHRPLRIFRNGTMLPPEATPTPPVTMAMQIERQMCELCGQLMDRYKMESHLIENHPEHAPYECLSCRIRFFSDYWELKEHYKSCSNNRIACDAAASAEKNQHKDVVEAPYFRKLYQPVECPFCRIYLGTFFDLDLHLNSHGLAAIDSKFACSGCNVAFTSVDALKRHFTRKNVSPKNVANIPQQSAKCFNTGRPLSRREIEKLKERYDEAARRDCMRKLNNAAYEFAPPKILECVEEAVCAFCHSTTKAYAHIFPDLSNLDRYGLECFSEQLEKEIIEKITDSKSHKNGRVPLCREHFQWKNRITKNIEAEPTQSRVNKKAELTQKVIRRKEETAYEEMGGASSAVGFGPTSSSMNEHSYSNYQHPRVMQEGEIDVMFKKEVKMEEDDWEDNFHQQREDGYDYDVIDISDDDENGEKVALPMFMDMDELEEKVSASLMISYTCPVCRGVYPTLLDLHTHQASHPEARIKYVCADCPEKIFSTPDDINKHFDDKKTSAVAQFYTYKILIEAENLNKSGEKRQ